MDDGMDSSRFNNSQNGFQMWIWFDDVKSTLTYFMLQAFSNFRHPDLFSLFSVELLNKGGALHLQT
jgi:hypothetical protein